MAQTTRYVTTGIIRDKEAILVENQKKEQALDAHNRVQQQYDQAIGQLGDVVLDEEGEKGAKSAPAPSVVGETGPDETKRSPEELKNHPEDNPTQTVEAANKAVERAKKLEEKRKSGEEEDREGDLRESVNELNKEDARKQEDERTGHKSHKGHKKHDK